MDGEQVVGILSVVVLAFVIIYIITKKILILVAQYSGTKKWKKDKPYLPAEFKKEYWIGRGPAQIGIGIGICIFSFTKENGIVFLIGGILWVIFGIYLTNRDSKK